jgi:putative SOS response-associated peptidase YedK
MCGRYVEVSSPQDLAPLFHASVAYESAEGWRPSWNIAPTTNVLGVATERSGERVIHEFRWGLVPSWAKDLGGGARAFNARAESVASKPTFRSAFRSKRLILPADLFYEWSHIPAEHKQPYAFRRSDGQPLAFAGLYEWWRDRSLGDKAPWLASCTLITTAAGPDMDGIHDRQPVVLEPDTWGLWLDRKVTDEHELQGLLVPSPAGTLNKHRVGKAVGNAQNDGPELIEEPAS